MEEGGSREGARRDRRGPYGQPCLREKEEEEDKGFRADWFIRWGSRFLAIGEGLRVNPWTSCCGRAQEGQVKGLL